MTIIASYNELAKFIKYPTWYLYIILVPNNFIVNEYILALQNTWQFVNLFRS